MTHDRITFVREYCLARRIPYRIKGEMLYIDGRYFCYSIYNLTYIELLQAIDKECVYDELTTDFKYRKEDCRE